MLMQNNNMVDFLILIGNRLLKGYHLMDIHYRATVIILVSIIVLGLIAIPFGNPEFIDRAIVLELSFVTISAFIWKGYSRAAIRVYPNSRPNYQWQQPCSTTR